jgi:hypothetical protein
LNQLLKLLLPLLGGLAKAAVSCKHSLNGLHVANIAWACVKLRYQHQLLLAALAAARLPEVQLSAQQLANTLYGFARLRQPLPVAEAQQLEQQVQAMSTQQVCNSCWALAVALADGAAPAEARHLWRQLASRVCHDQKDIDSADVHRHEPGACANLS